MRRACTNCLMNACKDFRIQCTINSAKDPIPPLTPPSLSSIQPCAEVLFLDIFHNYNQTLIPGLLDMVQNLQGQLNVNSNILFMPETKSDISVGLYCVILSGLLHWLAPGDIMKTCFFQCALFTFNI